MKFKATYEQFVTKDTTKTIRTGAGEIHAIIITSSSNTSELTVIYDYATPTNRAIMAFPAMQSTPYIIFFPPHTPIHFSTALTVVTASNSYAFFILAY